MTHSWTEKQLEELFKAVANRRRVFILRYLRRVREASVGDIASHLKLSLSTTSRHLNTLERSGFLFERQKSLTVFYSINPQCESRVHAILKIIT